MADAATGPESADALTLPALLNHPDEPLNSAQARWRTSLADAIYGPLPPPPDRLTVERLPLAGEKAERLALTIEVEDRAFSVDAALWLPAQAEGPYPLIAGFDFIGPAGIMSGETFPLDPKAGILPRPEYGANDGRLTPALRGTSHRQWPVDLLTARGYAVLVSCYGSWVPDDAERWTRHGLAPLLNAQGTGSPALSLWAWGILRLLDAAEQCNEIDPSHMIVAGHSRLGKSALWAAANDTRIEAVFAAHSGCAGAAPTRHHIGETPAELTERFPHWTRAGWPENVEKLPIDQHALIAAIAPRKVYLAAAEDDVWADPLGSYAALRTAASIWDVDDDWPTASQVLKDHRQVLRPDFGYHLRPGGHDLIPYDWHGFLRFLNH